MLSWCSYCLAFQGEKPPLEDLCITHGICEDCQVTVYQEDPSEDRVNALRQLQGRLMSAGDMADIAAIPALLEEGRNLGVRQVDMLVGLLAPLLWRIGQEWAAGQRTVAEEHVFSSWSNHLIAYVGITNPAIRHGKRQAQPTALLATVPGNRHNLGLHMLAAWLAERGITSRTLVGGLSANEVLTEIRKLAPSVIGLSISLRSQLTGLWEVVEGLPNFKGSVLVGGFAIKSGEVSRSDLPAMVLPLMQLNDLERHLGIL